MREVGAKMQDRLFSYFTKMYWAGITGGGCHVRGAIFKRGVTQPPADLRVRA